VANFHTPLLGLTKQITGENAGGLWGDTLNAGFMSLVEDAISGTSIISVQSSDVVVGKAVGVPNQARAMILVFTGTPGVARQVTVPSTQKMYTCQNDSNDTVTVKTASGTGVLMDAGDRKVLIVDQLLDEVIEVTAGYSNVVVPAPQYDAASNPGTWQNSTAGFPNVYMPITDQGIWGFAVVPVNFSTVTIAATTFQWLPTDVLGGSPTGNPWDGSRPAVDEDYPLFVLEAGTLVECYIRLQADGLAIEIFKCDGSAWVNPSVRIIADGVFDGFSTVMFSKI